MLNRITLLLNSGDLLAAINGCCNDVQLRKCWTHNKTKTIHVSASFNGRTLNAWGADANESIALSKALVELSERIHLRIAPSFWSNAVSKEFASHLSLASKWPILNAFMGTSSGMAAHFKDNEAQQRALLEMIERHVITKAMLEGISPQRTDTDSFIWEGPLKTSVALVRHLTKEKGSYLYGTAASLSKKNALAGAERELSALIPWSENSTNIAYLLHSATANKPSEIQAYHLSQKRHIHIFDVLNENGSIISPQISLDDVWFAKIPLLKPFEKTGIKMVRAFSPMMQPLYFGKLIDGPINPKAIDIHRLNIQADFNVVA